MWLIAALLVGAPSAFHVQVAPAESIWVDVRGAGPSVVLIPGLAGSAYGFRQLLDRLERHGYRAIVIEPLGVGRSSRPARADYSLTSQAARVAAVLDTLRETGVLLVAHSIGASAALRLAASRPDLVRGLVLIDGGAAESAATPSFRNALRVAPLLRLPGGRALARQEMASQLARASADRSWITDEVIDGYAQFVVADIGASVRAFQRMADAREPESLDERLSLVRAPVRLLVGGSTTRNAGLKRVEVERLRRQLHALHVDVIPGAGHYIHEERPDAVLAAIVALERELDARLTTGVPPLTSPQRG